MTFLFAAGVASVVLRIALGAGRWCCCWGLAATPWRAGSCACRCRAALPSPGGGPARWRSGRWGCSRGWPAPAARRGSSAWWPSPGWRHPLAARSGRATPTCSAWSRPCSCWRCGGSATTGRPAACSTCARSPGGSAGCGGRSQAPGLPAACCCWSWVGPRSGSRSPAVPWPRRVAGRPACPPGWDTAARSWCGRWRGCPAGRRPCHQPRRRAQQGTGRYAYQIGDPGPGATAPPIELEATDGKVFDLAAPPGQTTLLYFQEGLGCQPCWDQLTDIQANLDKYKALGITRVLSITTDPLDAIRQKVTDQHITIPVAADPDLTVSRAYHANQYGMMGQSRDGHSFILVGPRRPDPLRADYGGAPNYTMYVPSPSLLADLRAGLAGQPR